MARQITKYAVFIASPGDVKDARDKVVDTVKEWNRRNSVDKGIELEALRWENKVLPDIEARGQDE